MIFIVAAKDTRSTFLLYLATPPPRLTWALLLLPSGGWLTWTLLLLPSGVGSPGHSSSQRQECLTPVRETSCTTGGAAEETCEDDEICCPLTKMCVVPGQK